MNDIAPTRNTSFSTILPTLQLAWDSTSYDALDKCPRYYQYTIVEGYRAPGENDHFRFGGIFASSVELYERQRAEGKTHDQAILVTLRHALQETWDTELNRPWLSDEPTKTQKTLLRTIVWYLDRFQNENLKTVILSNGKPAVELSFRFSLNEFAPTEEQEFRAPTGEEYSLCGHMDKVVEWNDQILVADNKTSKYELDDNYFRQYTPNNQVSIYSIAGMVTLHKEIDGLIIDAAQILVNGSRFRRRQIPRSQESLEEWLNDFTIRLGEAAHYAEINYWPMNRKSCGFGRLQCTFRDICSAEPAIRQTLLDSHFVKRVWDPSIPR